MTVRTSGLHVTCDLYEAFFPRATAQVSLIIPAAVRKDRPRFCSLLGVDRYRKALYRPVCFEHTIMESRWGMAYVRKNRVLLPELQLGLAQSFSHLVLFEIKHLLEHFVS